MRVSDFLLKAWAKLSVSNPGPTENSKFLQTAISALSAIKFAHNYRAMLPEGILSVTETGSWKFLQTLAHWGYTFSLEFGLKIAIADTDFDHLMNSWLQW